MLLVSRPDIRVSKAAKSIAVCKKRKPGRMAGLRFLRAELRLLCDAQLRQVGSDLIEDRADLRGQRHRKNLSDVVAQFCSRVEVGSPSVFTWTV